MIAMYKSRCTGYIHALCYILRVLFSTQKSAGVESMIKNHCLFFTSYISTMKLYTCAKAGAQHTCVKAVDSIKKNLWWALVTQCHSVSTVLGVSGLRTALGDQHPSYHALENFTFTVNIYGTHSFMGQGLNFPGFNDIV